MKPSSTRTLLFAAFAVVLFSLFPVSALSQQQEVAMLHADELPVPDAPQPQPAVTYAPVPAVTTAAVARPATISIGETHRFWDRQNTIIFAAVAATSTADFFVTRHNLQKGGQELNPVTRMFGKSDAGLAANFAGETAGVIGLGYFFHKTNHHKLERMVPMANIGMSGFAIGFGLTH